MDKFSFECNDCIDVKINSIIENNDFSKVSINVKSENAQFTDILKIKWQEKCLGVFSKWDPTLENNICLNPNWDKTSVNSSASLCVPILSYIDLCDTNSVSVYLDNCQNYTEFRSGISEEDKSIDFELRIFPQKSAIDTEHTFNLIIDRRKVPLSEIINSAYINWNSLNKNCIPEWAYEPVYSTWYSMHQNVYEDELINELKIASTYGMKTLIIDDGWQTDDCSRGYSYCGEWRFSESKIPDIKKFVDIVHSYGMKCMLWYNVSYIGSNVEIYKQFENKSLKKMHNSSDDSYTIILDPRYSDVRKYIVNTYKNALNNYNIDGFKLDFIDSFQIYKENTIDNEMDCKSLEVAVCMLIDEINASLKQINPEVLIEFRQNYFGPYMANCANMIRVADCPGDSLRNRIWGTNLRLTCKNVAIHSDMLMWNEEETVENAALQFINTLFLVPQISVNISKLSYEHRRMMKFFLDFTIKNRSTLQFGEFKAYGHSANYSKIELKNAKKLIVILYADSLVETDDYYDEIAVVNGSSNEYAVINFNNVVKGKKITVLNCMGDIIDISEKTEPLFLVDIPKSGIAYIKGNT